MTDPKIEQPLLIPHEGRKPDWLEDDALVIAKDPDSTDTWTMYAGMQDWDYEPHDRIFTLSTDHWAAPVLRLRAETGDNWLPWNAELQGDGPPKDCAADGKTMMFGGHILDTNNLSFADHGTGRLIGYIATPAQQQESGEGVEPVAWMYRGQHEGEFAIYTDKDRLLRESGWTETPLYKREDHGK